MPSLFCVMAYEYVYSLAMYKRSKISGMNYVHSAPNHYYKNLYLHDREVKHDTRMHHKMCKMNNLRTYVT